MMIESSVAAQSQECFCQMSSGSVIVSPLRPHHKEASVVAIHSSQAVAFEIAISRQEQ